MATPIQLTVSYSRKVSANYASTDHFASVTLELGPEDDATAEADLWREWCIGRVEAAFGVQQEDQGRQRAEREMHREQPAASPQPNGGPIPCEGCGNPLLPQRAKWCRDYGGGMMRCSKCAAQRLVGTGMGG